MKRALLLLALLLSAAGCGDKTPMTDADVGTVTRWAAAYKPVAANMVAAAEALNRDQLQAAQTALDRVPSKLTAAEQEVRRLQTADLRATLADYMRITRRTITALEAFVAQLRTEPDDRTAVLRRQTELRDANDELFSADSKIRDRVFDHANADQEKALDPAIPLPVGG